MSASQTVAAIEMHPEQVLTDPHVLRWVVPPGILEPGLPTSFPAPLAELFAERVLRASIVEESAIWLWLAPELSWSVVGAQVRTALSAALNQPEGWQIEPADDAILQQVAFEVICGPVGEVIGSHGGAAELVSVKDNTVLGSLTGARSSCPAIEFTLRNRIDLEIRRRHSRLDRVVAV